MITKITKIITLSYYVDASGDITDQFFTPRSHGSMASTRIQIAPALNALSKCGHNSRIYSIHQTTPQLLNEISDTTTCFIGKLSGHNKDTIDKMSEANWSTIKYLKEKGARIVLTYCDNHICNTESFQLSNLYKKLFNISDYIILPSNAMNALVKDLIPSRTTQIIINDPWQVRELQDYNNSNAHNTSWKLIWFGSNSNFQYLHALLPKILNSKELSQEYELTILSGPYALRKFKEFFTSFEGDTARWTFRLVEWDISKQPKQLENELKRAHISIIPSNPSDPMKAGVSHNRLVDSIRSGCLTITSPMKSYIELSKIAIISDKIEITLPKVIADFNRLSQKHNQFRNLLLERFSPDNNQKSWIKAWRQILSIK